MSFESHHKSPEHILSNRRFEEMTDIAERLGYPIDTTIHYTMHSGAAYALSDTVERPFHSQTYQAMIAGERAFTGDEAFEVERLRLEHEEALMVDKLGSDELAGNVLIKLSKVPDAVVNGETSIKGYRRDLLRSFVRVYFRTETGVSCRLFTLDHNSSTGMKAVGNLLGIDTSVSSEKVLAQTNLVHVQFDAQEFVSDLCEQAICAYDEAVFYESGALTHAGSTYKDRFNALEVVQRQKHLMDQHMDSIATIVSLKRSIDELESERVRTAAAIKLSTESHCVFSNTDASVSAEVESGNYGRECATSSITTGMNQATQMENVWTLGQCQVCFAKTSVGSCAVCAVCAAADDRGVDLLKLREQNILKKRLAAQYLNAVSPSAHKRAGTPTPSIGNVARQYGTYAKLIRTVTIGGERKDIIDTKTNTILATL